MVLGSQSLEKIMILRSFVLLVFLFSFSCAFANQKTVKLPISSNPPGAELYIDGGYYGRTPVVIDIEPSRNYNATLTKAGYSKANILLETWYSIREKRGGADMTRCGLDAMGAMLIIPIFTLYSSRCRDFKEESYYADLYPENNNSVSYQQGGGRDSYYGAGGGVGQGNWQYLNYGGY
jgi:hypothetical protein